MTGTELQGQIQRIINDTNNAWSPTQYLEAINFAIRYVTKRRVDKNDPEFIFDLGIINGQDVPDNFMRFAGNFPITIKDTGAKRQFFHSQAGTPVAKFYVMRPTLATLADTLPMKSEHTEALKLCAAIYLKEQRGVYDMAKEKERLEALLT